MYEQSLVIIKPDGIPRRLVSEILSRFERAGFKLHAMKLMQANTELARKHYREHVNKPFYPSVEAYITEGPILVFVLGGQGCISTIRKLVGATMPSDATPGTIRGDLAHQPKGDGALRNLIHASASPEEAEWEISVWFKASELLDYDLADDELHGQ